MQYPAKDPLPNTYPHLCTAGKHCSSLFSPLERSQRHLCMSLFANTNLRAKQLQCHGTPARDVQEELDNMALWGSATCLIDRVRR